MESQMDRAHSHGLGQMQEQEPHDTVVEGDQDEHHHEKKSVLKKVKAKAKKIKDTLTKHGHGHDPDLDEENEEDEEMFENPEVHGAPIYESAAGKTAGQVENFGTSGVDTGRSTVMDVDPLAPNVKPGSHDHGQEGARGQHRVTLGSTTVMGEDPHDPENTLLSHNAPGINQARDNVLSRTVVGDVPHAPQQNMPVSRDPPGIHHSGDNVPSRTVMGDFLDPTGIHHSRDGVPGRTVMGDVPHTQQNMPASLNPPGIHHSRDNDPSRTFVHGQQDRPGQPKVNLDRPKVLEEDPAAPKDTPGAYYTSSNDQTRVTDPTGKSGEEVGITSVLHNLDKMNVYGGSEAKTSQEHNLPARNEDAFSSVPTGSDDQFSRELPPSKPATSRETFDSTKPQEHSHDEGADRPLNQGGYTHKISSATSAIADKAISAKNVVASKLGYGKKDNTGGHEMHPHDEGVERPSNQGGYTGKISSATSAIADKAISAKNVVASKLGYGEKDNTRGPEMHPHDEGVERPSNQGGYTEKISLATSAIADTAMSAKNVVASKLGYGNKDNTGGHEMHPHDGDKNTAPASAVDYGKVAGTGSAGTGTHTVNHDKGVSVKGYFAEKLRPGEEDGALSEVISEALHKGKPEQEQQATRPVGEVVSDAMHIRNEEHAEVSRPLGKVTESEEVARRLGTTKDEHDRGLGNKGMVDKIKGTVGSWLGKGDQYQGSQPSSARDDAGHNGSISGERRLKESGN